MSNQGRQLNDDTNTTNESSSSTTHPHLLETIGASACAGIVARLLTHPLDTVKARRQAIGVSDVQKQQTLLQAFRTSVRSLYRGLGTVLIGGTPGTVIYLTTYEVSKSTLTRWTSPATNHINESSKTTTTSTFLIPFVSGLIAEAIACIVYVPVDVVKERLQVFPHTVYRHSWHAVQEIVRTQGIFLGLYRGYGATLASFGPFSALYFLFYEQSKKQLANWRKNHFGDHGNLTEATSEIPSAATKTRDRKDSDDLLPFAGLVVCSATSGAAAAWLTSPLDMAKLRLQVQRSGLQLQNAANNTTTTSYHSVWTCLQHAWKHDDAKFRGLFRGAGARVLHFAPATAVTMTSFEVFLRFFKQQ